MNSFQGFSLSLALLTVIIGLISTSEAASCSFEHDQDCVKFCSINYEFKGCNFKELDPTNSIQVCSCHRNTTSLSPVKSAMYAGEGDKNGRRCRSHVGNLCGALCKLWLYGEKVCRVWPERNALQCLCHNKPFE